MIRGQETTKDRLYISEHVAAVLADIKTGFSQYISGFGDGHDELDDRYYSTIDKFEHERPKYRALLDPETLAEYEYDPSSFKSTLRNQCPIILRCLNSPARAMEKYQAAFNRTSGSKMLEVATHIADFGVHYIGAIDQHRHEAVTGPDQLDLAALDDEPYTAYGMIGGGIRSHFLYNLYPHAFPNRSQNAVWALYFLSGRNDYGFNDYSEFLMVEADGAGTQQNFFYPYDLFAYYALQIFLELKAANSGFHYHIDDSYRYVYVDTFLNYVAEKHRADIDAMRPQYEVDY